MALSMQSFTNDEVTLAGPLEVKVSRIGGGKLGMTAHVTFHDPNATMSEDNEKPDPVYTKNYSFDASVADGSENHIRQAYLAIKAIPEFSGASDI